MERDFPPYASLRTLGNAQFPLQRATPPADSAAADVRGMLLAPSFRDGRSFRGFGWQIMRALALMVLLLSAADHWTTYLCLRSPLKGWEVSEANPIAEWLFGAMGLVPGLLVDSALTVASLAFLLTTQRIPGAAKFCFFGLIAAWTGVAVVNNLHAISTIGLSLLGTS